MEEENKKNEQNIDLLLEEKLKPIIQQATSKVLGMAVPKLTEDISAKLTKSPLLDFPIDTSLKFKLAKKRFKKAYLEKMLEFHLGNITEVAREADTDRRSIHRLILELRINVGKIKDELVRPYDLKVSALSHAIEDVLDKYKSVLHPLKLEEMYRNVGKISEDLVKALPEKKLSLKEAEEEFEREYIRKALLEHAGNITHTAKKIGLRFETLHRKMKTLGLGMH
ncbi:hypothetical protein HZA99_02730 [Candidatus Woesearchaeota archaeon]|nr:hypothetical protein [Candidatus Woesearchaeota archaeon]